MDKRQILSKLAFCASLFALCVIALGAFTRLVDAGLGCPDWPGCYGHWMVPSSEKVHETIVAYKAWAEMIHRYVVSLLSILILCVLIMMASFKVCRVRSNIILAVALLFLLVYQIILGQWTVTLKLWPVVVTQHLLGGFLILTSLWLMYLINHDQTSFIYVESTKKILPWAAVGLVLVFLQISLGAWTSTNYASLSCSSFPFCTNHPNFIMNYREAFTFILPAGTQYEGGVLSESARQTIHMLHRVGALIVTLYLFIFAEFSLRLVKQSDALKSLFYKIIILLFVQIGLGISNVMFKLPLLVALAHNLVAALLLLSLVTLVYKLVIQSKKVKHG